MNKIILHSPENTKRGKKHLDSVEMYTMCQRGDQEAWEILYKMICKNIINCTNNKSVYRLDSIEDMAQDIVFFLLSGGIDKVKQPVAFFGFVKTVTRHRILDKFKKKFSVPIPIGAQGDEEQPDWDPPCTAPGPESLVGGSFFLEAIVNGISKLSENCHAPLTEYVAYKKDGKYASYKQLARKMNMRLGTLSSRITRCLEELSRQPVVKSWLEA